MFQSLSMKREKCCDYNEAVSYKQRPAHVICPKKLVADARHADQDINATAKKFGFVHYVALAWNRIRFPRLASILFLEVTMPEC